MLLGPATKRAYDDSDIIFSAWKVLLRRMVNALSSQKEANKKIKLLAEAITHLTYDAPSTTFEAMVLMTMFYNIQTYVDGINLRSLGRLDKLL